MVKAGEVYYNIPESLEIFGVGEKRYARVKAVKDCKVLYSIGKNSISGLFQNEVLDINIFTKIYPYKEDSSY